MQAYKIFLGVLGVGAIALAMVKGPIERYEERREREDRQTRAELANYHAEREAERWARNKQLAELEECALTYGSYFDDYAEGIQKANPRIRKASDVKPGIRIRLPSMSYPTGRSDPASMIVENAEEVDMYVDDIARFAAGEENGSSCVEAGLKYFGGAKSVFPDKVEKTRTGTESPIR